MRACVVSYLERGKRQSVEVLAETAYEAACLALNAFARMRYAKGPHRNTMLEIEVKTPRQFTLKVADVLEWLYVKPGSTAEQRERKKHLRAILASNGH